jgi:hypothetical protein
VSLERQLTKSATLSVTYLNSRGFDQLLSLSCAAGIPPCVNPPTSSVTHIYQFASEGNFTQNQLIVNSNVRVGSKLQLFGYYTLNYANSDVSGVSSFPSNSYHISQDYGRASFDTRHRLFFGGSVSLPHAFRLSPFMIATSGSPFNITSPVDLNGDTVFNDRPAFAARVNCATATIYSTPLGAFNGTPCLGQSPIPINFATGPAHFVLNLRLTKTFGLGPKTRSSPVTPSPGDRVSFGGGHGGGGPRGPIFGGGPTGMSSNSDRRYNLTLGVNARNILNRVNLANPSGILGSRFFDVSNALQQGPFSSGAANRRIDLQATFSF